VLEVFLEYSRRREKREKTAFRRLYEYLSKYPSVGLVRLFSDLEEEGFSQEEIKAALDRMLDLRFATLVGDVVNFYTIPSTPEEREPAKIVYNVSKGTSSWCKP